MSDLRTVPSGPVPAINITDASQDYPGRLVFGAPYFDTIDVASIIEPSVTEAVENILPALIPPYVDAAAQAAVQQLAVLLTGSTMSGPLFLLPLMPTQPAQAATMAYVDSMVATAGIPEVPPVPSGQVWARETGQWVPITPQTGVFLPLTGGMMQGNINMDGNTIQNMAAVPAMPNGAAPAQWVLNQIASVSLYQGTWNLDTYIPDLTQLSTHVNGYTWIAVTTAPAGVVISPPVPGLQGTTVYNGDTVIYSTVAGKFSAIHAGGITLPEADGRYVQLAGSQMSGALLLNANASQPLQAVTLQQLEAFVPPGSVAEAPNDGQLYGRNGLTHAWSPVLPLAGGILTGAVTLAGNATANLNPVPLQQMTSAISASAAAMLPLAGGAMTGLMTLSANASNALNPVPLQQLTSTLATYTTQTQLTAGLATTYTNVGRNLADNALFNIQQRGAGPFTTNGVYTADRYYLNFSNDTDSLSLVTLTDAQRAAIGDESAVYGFQMTFTGTSSATAYSRVYHAIEKARRLSGKTVTVSFWALASAPLSLGVSLNQNFGTGGSPSAAVSGAGQAVSIATTFARYQLTFNLASTAGKTFGTNGDDSTILNFWYSTGANQAPNSGIGVQSGTITLWGVQVEIGSVATPLEKLVPQQDLARCQRFYQAGSLNHIGQASIGGSGMWQTLSLPTAMRAAPSIVTNTTTVTNFTLNAMNTPDNYQIFVNGYTPAVGAFQFSGTFTASADL